jgi:hypothetical protein
VDSENISGDNGGCSLTPCCASSISSGDGSDHPLLDRGRWWRAEKWSSDLCELEFLHLLEWCSAVKSKTARTCSSDQEVETMLSLWQSWHRPHPSNVRDEYLAQDGRDIRMLEFGNWSLRVWEGFLAQRQRARNPISEGARRLRG